MRDLSRYIILTTDTFAMSSGYEISACKNGLKLLFEKGLADRGYFRYPRDAEEIAASAKPDAEGLAYKLTAIGMKRAIIEGYADESTIYMKKQWNGDGPGDMNHRVLVVEMMIRTRLEIAAQDRLVIGRMTPDFARRKNRSVNSDWITKKNFITPDMIFGLETFGGDLEAMYFVEVERARLQPKSSCKAKMTIARKIQPYGEYLPSSFREIKGAKQDVVLYVQDQTSEHLERTIPLVPWDEIGVRNKVLFSTFQDIREHGVLKGRWRNWRGESVSLAQ